MLESEFIDSVSFKSTQVVVEPFYDNVVDNDVLLGNKEEDDNQYNDASKGGHDDDNDKK